MAFCCCKKKKQRQQYEVQDAQQHLLNAEEENRDTESRSVVPVQLSGAVVDAGWMNVVAFAKLKNSIYVLCKRPTSVFVYQDETPFDKTAEKPLETLDAPWDMASSDKLECIYITDCTSSCIYKMSIPSLDAAPWLENVTYPNTLSVTPKDDHVLIVRYGCPSGLELYGPEADLARRVELPSEIEFPKHAVRTSTGNFLVIGKCEGGEIWGAFEVTNDGVILRRTAASMAPADSASLMESYHLVVDSMDRVIVADLWRNRLVMYDPDLKLNQVLLTQERNGLKWPRRLQIAPAENHLLVLHSGKVDSDGTRDGDDADSETWKGIIHVYEIAERQNPSDNEAPQT